LIAGIGGGDDAKEPAIDPERDETVNILSDLVDLRADPKQPARTLISRRRSGSCDSVAWRSVFVVAAVPGCQLIATKTAEQSAWIERWAEARVCKIHRVALSIVDRD
jgi:hypothetical protein